MKQRKSIYIKPLTVLLDLFIIFTVVFVSSNKDYFNFSFLAYISIFWLIISYHTKFYNVFRYSQVSLLLSLLLSQFFIFSLAYLSYFTVFREGDIIGQQIYIFTLIAGFITFFKFFTFMY